MRFEGRTYEEGGKRLNGMGGAEREMERRKGWRHSTDLWWPSCFKSTADVLTLVDDEDCKADERDSKERDNNEAIRS